MFCRSKLLICFHAVAFFSIRVISAMYTNHIDARSINVNSDIGKKFYMTLLFMILIMIVNIWELLKNWIDSRKKEFYIRKKRSLVPIKRKFAANEPEVCCR